MTQKADVLLYLQQHGQLTRATAFYRLGIAELSSRIGELEKEGWNIPRKPVTFKAKNGRKVRVMEYGRPIKNVFRYD